MLLSSRRGLSVLVLLSGSIVARAQEPTAPIKPFVPLRFETRQELDHLEAVRLYARGLLLELDNHLVEATATFERALRLDPEAAAICKALVSLYLALDRPEDALTVSRKALELDPDDHGLWQLLARQLRSQNRSREAAEALSRAIACTGLKEHPDLLAQLWFDLGLLWESIQELGKAESALSQAAGLLDDPRHIMDHGRYSREEIDMQAAETWERLGRVCIKARRFDQAVAAFRQAQKKDPTRATQLAFNLAEVYLAQEKPSEALQCLDAYLETQPQGTEAYEAKIKVLRDLGRGGDIVPAMQKYAARDRHNLALRLLLAREYYRANLETQAEQEYEDLLRQAPSADVYRGLFAMYRGQGRPGMERALGRLNRSLSQASPLAAKPDQEPPPGNAAEAAKARAMLQVLRDDPELVKGLLPVVADQMLGQNSLDHQTQFMFASLAARARQLDTAESLYRNCLARVEGMPRSQQEAQVYSGLLRVLWQAHKYDRIIELCEQGLERSRSTPLFLFHVDKARALSQLGKKNEAVEQANAAVKLAPRDGEQLYCRRTLVQVLAEAGRHNQAVAECEAMLAEFTQAGEVREIRYTLSSIFSLAKNYPKAEEQLQLILQAEPQDATACNDLGYIWADQGKNLAEAEQLIRKAIELDRKQRTSAAALSDQDNAAYVDSLGWVLFRRGQVPEARRELEKAIALANGDDDPVIWDHLGDVCFRQADLAQARSAWTKAVQLYDARRRPMDERYKEIKQKLKLRVP